MDYFNVISEYNEFLKDEVRLVKELYSSRSPKNFYRNCQVCGVFTPKQAWVSKNCSSRSVRPICQDCVEDFE